MKNGTLESSRRNERAARRGNGARPFQNKATGLRGCEPDVWHGDVEGLRIRRQRPASKASRNHQRRKNHQGVASAANSAVCIGSLHRLGVGKEPNALSALVLVLVKAVVTASGLTASNRDGEQRGTWSACKCTPHLVVVPRIDELGRARQNRVVLQASRQNICSRKKGGQARGILYLRVAGVEFAGPDR